METTKWTLTVSMFHILDRPDVQARLKAELAKAMPDASHILPWAELEKLPYLMGVVQESKSFPHSPKSKKKTHRQ